jgi:tetratricopeptide (TPR) repeat protein
MKKLCLAVAVVVAAAGVPASSHGGDGPAMALVDRYARGEFDAVTQAMAPIADFEPIYKDLKANAPKWIEAGGAADRERRRLAAATFAMEAAEIGAARDWKEVRMFMRLENIYWKPPSELLEWGCRLMRDAPAPTPTEHAWQMAALSVAGRAQDYEFLIGSPWDGRANKGDEILHLEHAIGRFPKDRRMLLAEGIAAELRLFPRARNTGFKEAQQIFVGLKDDPEVGAEAAMRLGALNLRAGQASQSLPYLASASETSRDPFVTYLANLFMGQAFDRLKDPARAEAAYRRALSIVPRAQSATFSLVAILAAKGARSEAASLVSAATVTPVAIDPWRIYGSGEYRFWPTRIAALRREIHQ